MPDIEEVLKAIVPLTFLAFWALSSLFNRETAKPPPRPGAGFGPRPGVPPGTRPQERPGMLVPREPAGMRRPPGGKADEEILIIRSEPSRAGGVGPRPGGGTPARRTARAKVTPPAPAKRAEPASSRPLSAAAAPGLTQPLDVLPLPTAMAAPSATSPSVAAVSTALAAAPITTAVDIRRLIGSRERLRDAILLNTILQPPVALRRGRRHL
jgi:hypothetical protein